MKVSSGDVQVVILFDVSVHEVGLKVASVRLGPLLLRVGTLALQGSQPEETPGGCSLGGVHSDETLGTDVVVRSLYCDLENVQRIEGWEADKKI